jgi:hypothetical protein
MESGGGIELTGARALSAWHDDPAHRDHEAQRLPTALECEDGSSLSLEPYVAARVCTRCDRRDLFLFDALYSRFNEGTFDLLDYGRGHKARLRGRDAPDLASSLPATPTEHAPALTEHGLDSAAVVAHLDRARVDKRFIPPDHLDEALLSFLDSAPCGVFWLQAPAHTGKTTFVQGLCDPALRGAGSSQQALRARFGGAVVPFYFKKEYRPTRVAFLQGLERAIERALDVRDDDLRRKPGFEDLLAASAQPGAFVAWLDAWRCFAGRSSRPLLVLIDGLDEATGPGTPESPIDLLPTADVLTEGLFFAMTSRRPQDAECPDWVGNVAPRHPPSPRCRIQALDLGDAVYVAMLERFVAHRLNRSREDPAFRDLLTRILEKAANRFAYVSFLVEQIEAGALAPEQLGGLASGEALYRAFLDRLDARYGRKLADDMRAVVVALAACEVAHEWMIGAGALPDPVTGEPLQYVDASWAGLSLATLAHLREMDVATDRGAPVVDGRIVEALFQHGHGEGGDRTKEQLEVAAADHLERATTLIALGRSDELGPDLERGGRLVAAIAACEGVDQPVPTMGDLGDLRVALASPCSLRSTRRSARPGRMARDLAAHDPRATSVPSVGRLAVRLARHLLEGPIMFDQLAWSHLAAPKPLHLLAKALSAPEADLAKVDSLEVSALVAPLPFYSRFKLLLLEVLPLRSSGQRRRLWALWDQDETVLPLDGTGGPVNSANELEGLALTEERVREYLRFFCFVIRGPEGAFMLLEAAPPEGAPGHDALAKIAAELTLQPRDDEGRFRVKGVMVYGGAAATVNFAVTPGGMVAMLDDVALDAAIPPDASPEVPDLVAHARATAELVAARTKSGSPPDAGRRREQPVQVLVEILLRKALTRQAGHRLIEIFKAAHAAADPIDSFAALLTERFPVVAVETSMPFAAEVIASIVSTRHPAERAITRCGVENSEEDLRPQLKVPGLLALSLDVYRRVADVDRVAFELSTQDIAAVIGCQRFGALPEPLRRVVDLTLRLPRLDAAGFEVLFERVVGSPPPADWCAAGEHWVKHVLHSDFEQPLRRGLGPAETLGYVRTVALDRLAAVDPVGGPALSELHGLGEARRFAEDLIADIHAALRGELPWAQVDRGALLVGPPGTGKTTLARAIAKDCGVRFIVASAASWQATEHLGHHIAAIRRTFAEARAYAPSILFIDEIDSLGSREGLGGDRNSQYMTEVINAVLEQMQELDPDAPIFVLAATNHEDRVDPALRRSGRLDRMLRIPRPNRAALVQIYQQYLSRAGALDPALDFVAVAGLSLGLTGADVERVVRGATRRARREGRPIQQHDLIAEITNKPRSSDGSPRMSPADLERTATHEAGHALAMYLSASRGADIGFVSIVPGPDGTLGFVAPLPDERVHMTRAEYEEQLEVFLGGRAAEQVRYGERGVSGGASSDLRSATAVATMMVTHLGLGARDRLAWSEHLAAHDAPLVEALLGEAYQRVLKKLEENRPRLMALAALVIQRQEITGDEARAALAG